MSARRDRRESLVAGREAADAPLVMEARGACAGYGGRDVVRDVSFTLEGGEVLCLLGPNGVGKTTLFKSLLGFIPLTGGELLIGGRPVDHRDRKATASLIGYVPQVHEPPFPFVVIDVVVMGSIARRPAFGAVPRGFRGSRGPARAAWRGLSA